MTSESDNEQRMVKWTELQTDRLGGSTLVKLDSRQ